MSQTPDFIKELDGKAKTDEQVEAEKQKKEQEERQEAEKRLAQELDEQTDAVVEKIKSAITQKAKLAQYTSKNGKRVISGSCAIYPREVLPSETPLFYWTGNPSRCFGLTELLLAAGTIVTIGLVLACYFAMEDSEIRWTGKLELHPAGKRFCQILSSKLKKEGVEVTGWERAWKGGFLGNSHKYKSFNPQKPFTVIERYEKGNRKRDVKSSPPRFDLYVNYSVSF